VGVEAPVCATLGVVRGVKQLAETRWKVLHGVSLPSLAGVCGREEEEEAVPEADVAGSCTPVYEDRLSRSTVAGGAPVDNLLITSVPVTAVDNLLITSVSVTALVPRVQKLPAEEERRSCTAARASTSKCADALRTR